MQKEKMVERLVKLKALAERGEGGEKETALRMYAELKEKYSITEAEIVAAGQPEEVTGKEFSDIMFLLYVLTNNLDEEMKQCAACPIYGWGEIAGRGPCTDCGTYANIHDLQKQYEELKRDFERGCSSA